MVLIVRFKIFQVLLNVFFIAPEVIDGYVFQMNILDGLFLLSQDSGYKLSAFRLDIFKINIADWCQFTNNGGHQIFPLV